MHKKQNIEIIASMEAVFTKYGWMIAALLIAISMLLSGFYVYQLYEKQIIDINMMEGFDSLTYHLRGKSIASGDMTWALSRQSIYHIVIGIIYFFFGANPIYVYLFQIILNSASCLLIFVLGRRYFNSSVGVIAVLIWLCYPLSTFYTGFLLRTTLIVFFNLSLIYSLSLFTQKKSLIFLVFGLVCSLLAISGRYNILLFLVLYVLWLLIFDMKILKKVDWNNPLITASLVVCVPVAFFIAWSQSYHIPMMNQWVTGNSYDSTGYYLTPSQPIIPSFSWDFIIQQLNKAKLFLSNYEAPNNYNFEVLRENVSILQYLPMSFGIILSFSMVGFAYALIRKNKIELLVIYFVAYSLSIILFFISSRHRLPVVPVLVILMAYAIYNIIIDFKEMNARVIALQSIILGTFILLSYIQTNNITNVRHYFSGLHRIRLSYYFINRGMHEESMREIQQVIQDDPTNWAAYSNLAYLYVQKDKRNNAINAYDKVIQINPNVAFVHFAKAQLLAQVNRVEEAEASVLQAIALKWDDPSYYYFLGTLYERSGNFQKAKRVYRQALSIQPDSALSHFRLGVVLWEHERAAKAAAAHLKRFIELAPENANRKTAELLINQIRISTGQPKS
jgi:tetratricopeptide (TPR) repeat protein